MRYLVKMKPLEPYAFGTEQGFSYQGEEGTGKESYFVKSGLLPEQTTVLGMLRYAVLSHKGLLKTSFTYSKEEQAQLAAAVGPESFQFSKEKKQDFGTIQSVSPVFLLNEAGEYLVQNPFHNTAQFMETESEEQADKKKAAGYMPMQMSEHVMETSAGCIRLPKQGAYDAKRGSATGFVNLVTGEIVQDLFRTELISGNRKNNIGEIKEGTYFKREVVTLKKDYAFAVLVEAESLPEEMIVYMGQKKSAFLLHSEETKQKDLETMVQKCFAGGDIWYYALSDLYVPDGLAYENFCIVEEKFQRNLETVHEESGNRSRLRKGNVRFHLIKRGSVFFEILPLLENENCKQIGYNHIVKLGGN